MLFPRKMLLDRPLEDVSGQTLKLERLRVPERGEAAAVGFNDDEELILRADSKNNARLFAGVVL